MKTINNLAISRKLILAFAILVIVMTGVSGAVYSRLSFIQDTTRWTDHTYMVLDDIHAAMAAIVDQETGLRGYMAGADEGFLEPYIGGAQTYDRLFAEVRELTADNPTQQQRLASLDEQVKAWRSTYAEPMIRTVKDPATRAQALTPQAVSGGKTQMDAIRAKVAEIAGAEQALLAQRTTEQAEAFSSASTVSIAGGIVALLVAVAAALLLSRMIARPVAGMAALMHRVAGGDLGVVVPDQARKDEVGQLAQALEVFRKAAVDKQRMEAEAAAQREALARREKEAQDAEQAAAEARRADAERTRLENETRRRADMHALADSFEQAVGRIAGSVGQAAHEMQDAANALSATAEETSRQATGASVASAQATTNVEMVASAAEELSASIAEIQSRVQNSAQIAGEAAQNAAATTKTVANLAEASGRIGQVVDLIRDIASKTNLLALNATIEAARAGEAGKGFAVVASEVKSLANQTVKATQDIADQIEAIQGVAGETGDAIRRISSTINQIDEITTAIAAAVEQQGAATQEIARNVQQAATGTQEVSTNVGGVEGAAKETGAASIQLLGVAQSVAAQAGELRTEMDRFLAQVRAA